jgi:hypothetical protein
MMLPSSAAPEDVKMDIGNQPRAPLQEQGTTQVAGLTFRLQRAASSVYGPEVPGVETIRTAAGLNKPVVEAPEPVPGGMETSCDL